MPLLGSCDDWSQGDFRELRARILPYKKEEGGAVGKDAGNREIGGEVFSTKTPCYCDLGSCCMFAVEGVH